MPRQPKPSASPLEGTLRAGIYTRVSTKSQAENTSLTTQRDDCRESAERHGWAIAGEYTDAGVSGATRARPGLDRLLADVDAGLIDVIVVGKLDRLGRSFIHLAQIVEHCTKVGVRVVFVSEGVDSGTDVGRLVANVMSSIAEFERTRIRERTEAGLTSRVHEGGFVGSTPPYGYRVVPDVARGRGVVLAIEPVAARCIREMFELLVVERAPMRLAVERLNEGGHLSASGRPWTVETLSRWARGSAPLTAAGVWTWSGSPVEIPAILTPSESVEWRAWLSETTVAQTHRGAYLLSGLVRTPCGRNYHGRTAGTQAPTYSCRQHLIKSEQQCGCLNISAEALDSAVWDEVVGLLTDPAALLALAAEQSGITGDGTDILLEIGAATEVVTALQNRIAADYQSALDDGFDAATARLMMRGLQDELKSATAEVSRLGRLRAKASRSRAGSGVSGAVGHLRDRIADLDLDGKRAVMTALGVEVTVSGYEPCPACAGSGYGSMPAGSGRRWPPSCGHCRRMRMLPVVEVAITAPEALLGLGAEAGEEAG